MATNKSVIAYIKIMNEKIVCGVGEPMIFSMFKEKIAKTFESLNGETNLKEIEFIEYFKQASAAIAAK